MLERLQLLVSSGCTLNTSSDTAEDFVDFCSLPFFVDPIKELVHSFSETLLPIGAARWFPKGIQCHYLAE